MNAPNSFMIEQLTISKGQYRENSDFRHFECDRRDEPHVRDDLAWQFGEHIARTIKDATQAKFKRLLSPIAFGGSTAFRNICLSPCRTPLRRRLLLISLPTRAHLNPAARITSSEPISTQFVPGPFGSSLEPRHRASSECSTREGKQIPFSLSSYRSFLEYRCDKRSSIIPTANAKPVLSLQSTRGTLQRPLLTQRCGSGVWPRGLCPPIQDEVRRLCRATQMCCLTTPICNARRPSKAGRTRPRSCPCPAHHRSCARRSSA
jgi:hypothetical protein